MKKMLSLLLAIVMLMTLVSTGVLAAPPSSDETHIVAGDYDLCGSIWDPSDSNNRMTYSENDGCYYKTYENVNAGTYNFKVTTNGRWDAGDYNLNGSANHGGSNATAVVTENGSTVIIGFNGEKATLEIIPPGDGTVNDSASTTYAYAYDARRTPYFPSSKDAEIKLSDFGKPLRYGAELGKSNNYYESSEGEWTLTEAGTYSEKSSFNPAPSEYFEDVISEIAEAYGLKDGEKEELIIHKLTDSEDAFVAYGFVTSIDEANGYALFISDVWNDDGASYFLSQSEITADSITLNKVITTYTITFDANGGSGTMAAVSGVTGEYTLPECTFTAPDGKQFKAWSVDSSEKAVGEKITVTADTTVKAIWEEIVNDDNTDPEYYLVGMINNSDHYEKEYKFIDGKIEFKFTSDSYVAVMDSEENIYWTDGWLDFDPTEATLKRSGDNKMHISPKSDNRTLWLTVNDDGTLTLSTVEPAPTYKVTFDANGGTVDPASAKTNEDGKLATLPTPTRSDYTFNGWYTASSDGVQVTAETVFEADTTIYAQWSYNGSIGGSTGGGGVSKYTVKFNTNGGTKVANKTVKKNTILAEPAAPTKDGYTFDGWYTDKNFTNAYNFDKKVTKSITLYAKWVEVKPAHSCTFDSFNDLDDTKWYHEDIEYVLENKIMLGVSDTAFAPDESLTRGMLVTILYRSEGEPATNKSVPFADVDMGAYYANAASWAQQNGIVNGISDTEFAPDMNVTREQLATIMYRYACLKGMDAVTLEENLNFNDATDVSEWAVTAMNWGVGRNYIFSRNAGSIAPNDAATRAEVAAFIHRYVENIVK